LGDAGEVALQLVPAAEFAGALRVFAVERGVEDLEVDYNHRATRPCQVGRLEPTHHGAGGRAFVESRHLRSVATPRPEPVSVYDRTQYAETAAGRPPVASAALHRELLVVLVPPVGDVEPTREPHVALLVGVLEKIAQRADPPRLTDQP